ncbi:MAG: ABC transporter substrate-binding protein [Treponema sp.]|jgi:putative ABC transport system substrate-binding protein|nr:ABC transporter substrate-binding protein [Treponema sp.]
MNKIRVLALALVLAMSMAVFSGCERGRAEGVYLIGIFQYFSHAALDASREGFVNRLAELGFVEGENVQFIVYNPQRDAASGVLMAARIAEALPDLVLTIATGASQIMSRETDTIPIVVTAVTSPLGADLVESNERPGRNVTGVSDLTPVALQIDLITRLLPQAQRVGLVYNAGEINSVIQANIAREAIRATPGLTYVVGNVTGTADIADVVQSIVGQVDVIYVPTCNTVAAAYPIVMMTAEEAGIPVVAGEVGGVRVGALATEGIDYYLLGRQTADMAAIILRGEGEPATMPIQWQQEPGTLVINMAVANRLGINISQSLLDAAGEIITN